MGEIIHSSITKEIPLGKKRGCRMEKSKIKSKL
jgi:hypothetical protein